jgi:hypothetical protein
MQLVIVAKPSSHGCGLLFRERSFRVQSLCC